MQRIAYIDIAKGISIILVALSHSKFRNISPDAISAMGLFRMPLFFFVSGVFFSSSVGFRYFLYKKADVLLKPYFFTSLVILVSCFFIQEDYPLTWEIKRVLYGNGDTALWAPMWFLTHLFVVYCFTYIFFYYTSIQERGACFKTLILFVLIATGTQLIDVFSNPTILLLNKEIVLPGLPFSLDLVFINSSFFMMGWFLRKSVFDFKPNHWLSFVSVIIFISIACFSDAHIDLNKRNYTNPVLATGAAILGIYFILYMSYCIERVQIFKRVLTVAGHSSLFILVFHWPIGRVVYDYFEKYAADESRLWPSFFAFIMSIVVPVLIKAIVLKSNFLSAFYLPATSKNVLFLSQNTVPKR